MLLVIDVGNTNIVLGIFQGELLVDHWRVETRPTRTGDETGILLMNLLGCRGYKLQDVTCTIISSVVPSTNRALEEMCERYLGHTPMIVGPGMKTSMPILVDNPRELGADRIVNSVAAWEKHKSSLVVVDFGTATTFDCVSRKGEYVGGAIAPGFQISAEALFRNTSKLPRIDLEHPRRTIGRNTIASMQAGLFFGYVGLVDELVRRCQEELGAPRARVVATGGLASLVAEESRTIEEVDKNLTLDGLRILFERNREATS